MQKDGMIKDPLLNYDWSIGVHFSTWEVARYSKKVWWYFKQGFSML